MSDAGKLLVFTNAYPYPGASTYGVYVSDQVAAWRAAGVDVALFFINGRKSRWNYLGGVLAWALAMARRGRQYDAIAVHHSYCCLIASCLRWPGIPIVYQVHEGTIHFSRVNRWLVRLAVRVADRVVYVSSNLPIMLGRSPEGATILPCGIDLERFQPMPRDEARRALGWALDEEVILYAAKERPAYERFDLVLEAVRRLADIGRHPHLLRLEGVEPDRVPLYLNAADVLVLASRGEGSPKIIKEALACERPIVSLRVGSVPEMLEGVESGFLAEVTPEDLTRQLLRALALEGRGMGRDRVLGLGAERTSSAFLEICRDTVRRKRGLRIVEAHK